MFHPLRDLQLQFKSYSNRIENIQIEKEERYLSTSYKLSREVGLQRIRFI